MNICTWSLQAEWFLRFLIYFPFCAFLQREIQKWNATQISECSDMGKFEQHLSLLW